MKTICVISTPKSKQAPFVWKRKLAQCPTLSTYSIYTSWIELNCVPDFKSIGRFLGLLYWLQYSSKNEAWLIPAWSLWVFWLKSRNMYDCLCMKSFISDHVLSHNYINTLVQLNEKEQNWWITFLSVYHLFWTGLLKKSRRDLQIGFRIMARDESLILQNISVMASKAVAGS